MGPLPANDLDEIFHAVGSPWEELRGQRVFITGGTGFYGRWLLESFVWANDRLKLDATVTVLTRDPERFGRSNPHLSAQSNLEFVAGDVRDFEFPAGRYTYVIHAATEASAKLNDEEPLRMFDTNVVGTRRTLEFARQCGARRFLFASSGAVYGKQPAAITHVAEDFMGGPDPTDPRNAYAEGKRSAEMLGVLFAKQHGFDFIITRGFAFIGPLLPLDIHFAVGNFIRDGLNGGPVRIGGDGTPYRSYLYASDLAAWLWTILLRGAASRAYNIGGEEAVTILELAKSIAAFFGTDVVVARQPATHVPPDRYVPSTCRAREELGLRVRVPFADALARTVEWHLSQGKTGY
jgi:nucleoside-diphosphate-sugar epimerase